MTRAKDISKIVTDAALSGTLDVTGDLTVDNATLKVDSTNNRVGISTSSMTSKFEVAVSDNTTIQEAITIKGTQGGAYGGYLGWKDNWSGDSYTGYRGAIIADVPSANSGRLRFFTANSSTLSEKMRIDSSGNVGIGTSSPDQLLHVKSSGNTRAKIEAGTTSSFGQLYLGTENQYLVGYGSTHANEPNHIGLRNANASGEIFFVTGGSTERMRIDSSGNVGIGASSTDALESRTAQGYRSLRLNNFNINAGEGAYGFIGQNIYQDSAGVYKFIDTNDSSSIHFWGNSMQFHMANGSADATQSGSEKMRIDSSGNVFVSKTTLDYDTPTGHVLRADGFYSSVRSGGNCADFNRRSSDGEVIRISKDGTTVGNIGVANTDQLTIGTSDGSQMGLRFDGDLQHILPANASGAKKDALADLGSATARWRNIYFSGGVYLGGTGSANKLDDYEEGTWTPTYEKSTGDPTVTYGTRVGYYVKVGNLVYINFDIDASSISGGSGTCRIGGIPFNVNNSYIHYPTLYFRLYSALTLSSNHYLTAYMQSGSINFQETQLDNGDHSALTAFDSSGRVSGTAMYYSV